jgi:homoserine O-succinyltransferase
LQGHPEYESVTLLKEYRRDIGRYVRAQQPHYPSLPQDYFCTQTVALLNEFRKRAELDRRPQVMADFPVAAVEASLRNTWHAPAVDLYRNWLELVAAGGREMVGAHPGMLQ